MTRGFDLVDVFAEDGFAGNPLAVIHDADGIEAEAMQRVTRWLNLSETTFVLPPRDPRADYRVRIFSLSRELPFAGHPTLGTCHAWLARGGRPKDPEMIVQECGAGLIPVRRQGDRLAFAAPPLTRSGPVDPETRAEITGFLRLRDGEIVDMAWIDNGPGWLGVLLASAEAVLAVDPARHHPRYLAVGLIGPHPPGADAAFELRALFIDQHGGTVEDPVTGSLNAAVAHWLIESGRAEPSYIAAQGTKLGRRGRVAIDRDQEGRIWVGGATHTLFSGTTRRW